MDQMALPQEVTLVTAAPNGHVILGVKDRAGDNAAVVLNPQQIEALAHMMGEALIASMMGQSYQKAMVRVVAEKPEGVSVN